MDWQEFTALPVSVTATSFSPGPDTTFSTARFARAVPRGSTLLPVPTATGMVRA